MTLQRGKADVNNFKRYRAPKGDGQALFDPPWQDLSRLVADNQRYVGECSYDFLGASYAELRDHARRELVQLVNGQPNEAQRPLILTGHQPELFHPGVWLKNFAAGALARRVDGLGVNLVIDSDLCRGPGIRVPTGDVEKPRAEVVAYDAARPPMPYEERGVADLAFFESFPNRVVDAGGALLTDPLLTELWPTAVEVARTGGTLAQATSTARHAVEVAWGNPTRETPISRVCDTRSFARFAMDILARLPDFHAAHNQALAEYRTAHRLRSPAQPMPDLHEREGWLEAPLWVWTTADPIRRPLYARLGGQSLELTDFATARWETSLQSDASDPLATLREQGCKLRSRALVTTLFARLLLADLFLHGIGGAKYDEAADLLAQYFYGFAPPPHATVTATQWLPIEHERFDPEAPQSVARKLRELEFHPEKFLADDPAAKSAKAEKLRWIAMEKTPENAGARHQAITGANAALQTLVKPQREELLKRQKQLEQAQRAASVLASREYSFCLFPAQVLRKRLTPSDY